MHNILETFSKVYLINLKKRPERLKKWLEDNKLVIENLSNLEIIEAVDGTKISMNDWGFSTGALGCLESHLNILKDAKQNKCNRILVLEDDFIFDENFMIQFNEGYKELPDNWDMLYLYSSHFKNPKPYSEHLYRASAALSTVAYAVNAKTFDLLIKVLELKVREVDVIFAHMHFLINAYAFKKNICHHYDGYSDVQNINTNYHQNNDIHPIKKKISSLKSKLFK